MVDLGISWLKVEEPEPTWMSKYNLVCGFCFCMFLFLNAFHLFSRVQGNFFHYLQFVRPKDFIVTGRYFRLLQPELVQCVWLYDPWAFHPAAAVCRGCGNRAWSKEVDVGRELTEVFARRTCDFKALKTQESAFQQANRVGTGQ